ncbi:virulence plasmid b [Fusarium phyllophilum]|uniref:Virulence plasmid b n=1 Tax=Fusarium phyllophilum TaxID=47803 RepID=A0A8H5K3I2_9HYPO|nr:virulence plasmid b [Fusarium phyllophilum]
METAGNGNEKVQLLPATFGYTSPGVSGDDLFKPVQNKVINLRNTTNNVALFTLNISGRSMADLACIRFNPESKAMSIKTYLADRVSDGSVSWDASKGPHAEAILPTINFSEGFPSILAPDISGDGRSDLIIPYCDNDGMVRFSISESTGTGFKNFRPKTTSFKWTTGSKFIAGDFIGRGRTDIVQIYTEKQKLAFRNFSSVSQNGQLGLRDAAATYTKYENIGTIDWFLLAHASTGAASLVRVWAEDRGKGMRRILATPFHASSTLDSNVMFEEGEPSVLESSVSIHREKYNVVTCDINGDGTQDIVLATAEYQNGRMKLAYTVFLGNGLGQFQKHGTTITRDTFAPRPLSDTIPGQFHTTNLNGSNYPSISYTYQEQNSKAYICLSVDGQCDGRVGDAKTYRLAGNIPSKMEVVPADLNGNGIGDWLLYSIENDQVRVVPIYNNAQPTDFLSWARDPMGLETSLTYGTLSDPSVYTPSISWKNYKNQSPDSYQVLGAPNYVVTSLSYQNYKTVNSLDYSLCIRKSYSSAVINTKGRGWQGFGEIYTLNVTDGILTTEKYVQTWPMTGLKCQIDNKNPEGKLFKSDKTSYDSAVNAKGPWKIYHNNKTIEQTEMWEGDSVARRSTSTYAYDHYGNVTTQLSSESVQDQLALQTWQRCTYTTINGITGLITSKKISSKEGNTDMANFESGDASLILFEYDSSRAVLSKISEWSSDIGGFSVKNFAFDPYGNEIVTVDAAGLKTTTTYDAVFNSFPVKVEYEGPGTFSVHLAAFDEASGQEVAKLEQDGALSAYRIDQFGRAVETRLRSTSQDATRETSSDFFAATSFVSDISLSTILATTHLDPYRSLSFERRRLASGLCYIGTKALMHSGQGTRNQSEILEVFDCVKQVRKKYTHHGENSQATHISWEYDSRGNHISESFPVKIATTSDWDWTPNQWDGFTTSFDILGRPTKYVRPAHGDGSHYIVSSTAFLDGGAKIQERTLTAPTRETSLADMTQVSLVEKRYLRIGQEDVITEIIDESGLRSTFHYDISGNMTLAIDPAGNKESRTYNTKGMITTINNKYQNAGLTEASAITYRYNAANYLISESNASGDTISYERDAQGRPLRKTGKDGRAVVYLYESAGVDKPSTILIYPQESQSHLESQFDFVYDPQGRVKQRKLTVADGTSYITTMVYNWQGDITRKVFPDGAVLENEYQGSLAKSSTLSGGSASTWTLQASMEKYGPAENVEETIVKGTGLKDNFTHSWAYDTQGFPLKHSLDCGESRLVEQHYRYNDSDKLVRRHEFLSGSTTDYSYQGQRLISSRSEGGIDNLYSYDASGNLTHKRGVDIEYAPGQARGIKDGKSLFDVSYDASGRMIKRTAGSSTSNFIYDSFGWLKSYISETEATSIDITTDFEGETLQRQHSDGSRELMVSSDFSIHSLADGLRIVRHKLFAKGFFLGTISNMYESATSSRPLGGGRRTTNISFSDTKGNVTHVYKGEDAELREKLDYDDYGSLGFEDLDTSKERDRTCTYEGKMLDEDIGLLDFGGRWYDPLVGRFTTADDIVDLSLLTRTDGLNRYAFENNDPINHVDPTGHWSWSAIAGVALGAVMIAGAIALTVATGGAAGFLAAAAVGALGAGGLAGITYSIDHHSEEDTGKFWGGFGTTVAINALIGGATGALGAVATPARAIAGTGRLVSKMGLDLAPKTISLVGKLVSVGGKALLGGTASVLTKATERSVSNMFYGTNYDLFADAGSTFASGALVGGIVGAIGCKSPSSPNKLLGINKFNGQSFKLRAFTGVRSILAPKPTEFFQFPSITSQVLKATAAKTGGLASYGYRKTGLDKEVNAALKAFGRGAGLLK